MTEDFNQRFPGNDIHPTAVIGPNVTMGAGNYIGPYCVIGMPGEHREKWGEDKGVLIGDRCKFTGHVTIDAGIEGRTMIGDNAFIMKHAHVGHDAVIYPSVTISCGAKIGGHTIVQVGVNIGLNAVIHQKHSIAANVMIAMGAVVTLKCHTREGYMYAGNPAVERGRNKRAPSSLFDDVPATPVKCGCNISMDKHLASIEHELSKPLVWQTEALVPNYHPFRLPKVELPISVVNNKQVELGIDNPEEGRIKAFIVIDDISVIRQVHDDSLGDTPLNTEATMIHLKSGETFFIPLYIDDVMKLIDKALP